MLTVLDLSGPMGHLPFMAVFPSVLSHRFTPGDWMAITFPNHSHVLAVKHATDENNEKNTIRICSSPLRAYFKLVNKEGEDCMIASVASIEKALTRKDDLTLEFDAIGVIEDGGPATQVATYSMMVSDSLVDASWFVKHYLKEQDVPFAKGTIVTVRILDYDVVLKLKAVGLSDAHGECVLKAEKAFFKIGKRARVKLNFLKLLRKSFKKSDFLRNFAFMSDFLPKETVRDDKRSALAGQFFSKLDRTLTIFKILLSLKAGEHCELLQSPVLDNLNTVTLIFDKGEEELCDFFFLCLRGKLANLCLSSSVKFFSLDISLISSLFSTAEFGRFWVKLQKEVANLAREGVLCAIVIENFSELEQTGKGVDQEEDEDKMHISLAITKFIALLESKNVFIFWKVTGRERSSLIKNETVPSSLKKTRDCIELKAKDPILAEKIIEFKLVQAAILDEKGREIEADERKLYIKKVAKNLSFKSFEELLRGVMKMEL